VNPVFADSIVEGEQVDIGGGLTASDLFVNGNEGLSSSFFVDLAITSIAFNEVTGFGDADITSSGHLLWDNRLGDANDHYVDNRNQDSLFF